jgi:ribonucleoside-diphosphate reductase alpha chain
MSDFSPFAQAVFAQKYSMDGKETWEDTSRRVAYSVMSALPRVPGAQIEEIERLIAQRKFIPGGRYLYAAGRDLHQVNNCLLMKAEDWSPPVPAN